MFFVWSSFMIKITKSTFLTIINWYKFKLILINKTIKYSTENTSVTNN